MKFIQEICKKRKRTCVCISLDASPFCGCHVTRHVLICNSSASIKFYKKKEKKQTNTTKKKKKKKKKKTMNK